MHIPSAYQQRHPQGRQHHPCCSFMLCDINTALGLRCISPCLNNGRHILHQCCFTILMCGPQLRRSRAWFPCVDQPLAACPFELHFTVPASQMAISCGQLVKQKWTDGAKRRTFHYKLSIATPPQDIAVVVGQCVLPGCMRLLSRPASL